ncbi:hypothetical protein C8Q76DRAFT_798830 [Earliella scabrosa]|nr:hypothetical protein C8Q76DRAFT_798830 [Earliella scabrosa]
MLDTFDWLVIGYWKKNRLRETDLLIGDVVGSLSTSTPMVEARLGAPGEWHIVVAGTDEPAVFTYAGVFASADDYETGNLLPPSKDEGESVGRFWTYANRMCKYSYALETRVDRTNELWTFQAAFDAYMSSLPGFNPLGLPRSEFQSSPKKSSWFWLKMPMFIKLGDKERKPRPPSFLHQLVIDADDRSHAFRANPLRTSVRAMEGGRARDIVRCTPDKLERGDTVAVRFKISYYVGGTRWQPEFMPIDIVRVKTADPSVTVYQLEEMISTPDHRLGLADDEIIDREAAARADEALFQSVGGTSNSSEKGSIEWEPSDEEDLQKNSKGKGRAVGVGPPESEDPVVAQSHALHDSQRAATAIPTGAIERAEDSSQWHTDIGKRESTESSFHMDVDTAEDTFTRGSPEARLGELSASGRGFVGEEGDERASRGGSEFAPVGSIEAQPVEMVEMSIIRRGSTDDSGSSTQSSTTLGVPDSGERIAAGESETYDGEDVSREHVARKRRLDNGSAARTDTQEGSSPANARAGSPVSQDIKTSPAKGPKPRPYGSSGQRGRAAAKGRK